MMHLLYPQLSHRVAAELADEYGEKSPEELQQLARLEHETAIYSPTGGTRVSSDELRELAEAIRRLREEHSPSSFDAATTRYLHPQMNITRSEASLEGVWSFMGCVLLPDVVRWRFPSKLKTPEDRFLGTSRGLRNVLGRCWWRGELLCDHNPPPGKDGYWLLNELGEDELTGLVERPRAVASRRVAVALAKALVSTNRKGVPQMDVARDAFKRYLRLSYFVAFDALADYELEVACESLYRRAVRAVLARR